MRSSVLLSSALAIGAIATPVLDKRYYVTEVDLEIKTVTVYVTPGAPEPTVAAISSYGQRHRHSHKPSSKAAPKPTEVYTPPPAYTPAPTPVQSSKAAPVPSAPAAPVGSHKSGTIQSTFSSGPDYEATVVYHHNAARANHRVGQLEWDDNLAATAKQCAEQCIFKHYIPEGVQQGQNIFANSGDSFNVSAAITESWYKGELPMMQGQYGKADIPNEVFHSVGHLTQMVWKETTKVGCFSQDCGSGMKTETGQPLGMNKFTVCNYATPGNWGGKYAENVLPPISTSNLPSWTD